MKKIILLSLTLFVTLALRAQTFDYGKIESHPRLLLKKGEEAGLLKKISAHPELQRVHDHILKNCDKFLSEAPLERKLEGKRLLDVSRSALKRIFYLSYAYRMTKDKRYAQRAEQEMLTVSAFSDWNPAHFLDVGEMTMAVAIGYDWLFDVLQPSSKQIIRQAIVAKGFDPSRDQRYNSWLKADHNWNQVCNAGIAYGAMAVFEDEKVAAIEMLERCMKTIVLPMHAYAPDGAYPEGYNYWGYGTGFQVMLNAGIESAFGTDKGLSAMPGFLESARYMEYMTGPTGASFNFSDAREPGQANVMMSWFAFKLKDPSLLWVERQYLQRPELSVGENRLLPCMVIFGIHTTPKAVHAPASKVWIGKGVTPVALVRTNWNAGEGLYLGVKGGSAHTNHAHMDAGSFVFDALGVRWAMDLGLQEYYSLEKEGVDLWNRSQQSQRWEVFRYNNFAHNTLTLNDKLHRVDGFALLTKAFTKPDTLGAAFDLTTIFKDDLEKCTREAVIVQEKFLLVKDILQTGDAPATIRWTLVTAATPSILNPNTIVLTSGGKKLHIVVESATKIDLKIWSAEPTHSYDAPNPGVTRVGFETRMDSHQKNTLQVKLIPQP
ncbi:heparinase II/III domain-containing protein [Chryseolinea lacunae]|uniref:Heparinase II/III family protein n=1 Tax=Chryseolinea lacunae TaxID=2801331 RepID=A0ABS1L338_9BACT|nr:heparinase II/III family protein [Chryseolinea lacunae]MBL0745917.1 heparinase II/III family protein [Chryseolinea lacunae]